MSDERRIRALRNIAADKRLVAEVLARVDQMGQQEAVRSGLESFEAGLELPTPPTINADAARRILEEPESVPFLPDGLALEAIILTVGRPVLFVKDDTFVDVPSETWNSKLEAVKAELDRSIVTVGRINLRNNPLYEWVGTAWLVRDDVLVTNRHVAVLFGDRDGQGYAFRQSGPARMEATIDFRREYSNPAIAEFKIKKILHIESANGPEIAFLRVDWENANQGPVRRPIGLANASPSEDMEVAVIGYPAKDPRTKIPTQMDQIYDSIYNVKRLAPGKVSLFPGRNDLFTHDCTTLGGNSGSIVVGLADGQAVGLHFGGIEKTANYAVAAPVVIARLKDLGF
jgi:endonuclease G